MGINMQGFTRGFADEEKKKDKTRAEMAQLWRETKKENPYASAQDLHDILDAAMGGLPAGHSYTASQGVPTDEVIERLGAANKIKRDFDHRGKQLEQMIKQQSMEESARSMFQKDILNYSLEDIRSGAAREKMRKSHPQMFESINGMEPLISPSQFDEWTSENVWKREQGQWQASKLNDIKSWIQQNPEGSAQELAETMTVPVHVVQGPYDFAKKEYEIAQKKAKRDDKRAVVKELKSKKALLTAFGNAASGSEARLAIKNAINLYYNNDEDLINQLDPSVIDDLETELQAQSDEATRTLNEAKRDKLGKEQGSIIEQIKEDNIADVEGRYGKRGSAMSEFGDAAHAVSSYMNNLAKKYVIDYKAMDLLEDVFHQASADGVTKVGELEDLVMAKNILPKLRPISGRDAIEAYKDKIRPETQTAKEWSKDVLSELHDERERINGAITDIDASAIANPTVALQKFKILLRSLQSRYPMGADGKLTNARGSAMRDIIEDISKDREWRTGGVYSSQAFRSDIEPELNNMANGVTQAMDHISFLMNLIEHNLKNPVKGVTGVVQNTEGGGVYPSPSGPTRTGR
jgi:hypothetical protein